MAVNFPNSPTLNQTFTAAGVTWKWDGVKWVPLAPTVSGFVPLSGGTMTGPLVLSADPTAALGAVTKQYSDHKVAKAGDTMTGNLTIAPLSGAAGLLLNAAAPASGNNLVGEIGGNSRWAVSLGNGSAESGGNAGSDFAVVSYNDAGAQLAQPFSILRASGNATFTAQLTVSGQINASQSVVANTNVVGAGSVYGGGLYANYPTNDMFFGVSGGQRILQWATNWYDSWRTSDGWRSWVCNSVVGMSLDASGNLIVRDNLTVTGGTLNLPPTFGGNSQVVFMNSSQGAVGYTYFDISSSYLRIVNLTGSTGTIYLRPDSYLIAGAGAAKPGGGAWVDSSDARIKTVAGEYVKGLAEVLQLQPVVYTYKGNDTDGAELGEVSPDGVKAYSGAAPFPGSLHYQVAVDQKPHVGLVAQDVEGILPGLVSLHEAYIDGEKVNDMRYLDTSELIFTLVNAVKTLAARIEALEKSR